MVFNLEKCKYDFATDVINIIVLLYDYSTSMKDDMFSMRKANEAFYDDFLKFDEKGSVAIAKGMFSSGFDMTNFIDVKKFDTSYYADGMTAFYYAVVRCAKNTIAYYNEIIKRLNVRARITFLVFTDGQDNESNSYSAEAKNMIKELNSLDATTVLVAFNEAIGSGIGEEMGFTCVKDIHSVEELVRCMGIELSKSCKEQSKSAYSLKSEFFSRVDDNAEEDDTNNQLITDDDFFTDL